ncbi:MAG: MraY family glycosyltransferase [Devosia sp.]
MVSGLFITLIAGFAAFVATWLILRHAQHLGVIQIPNARSSHSVPTPSGGGVGIVIGGAIGTSLAAFQAPLPILLVLAASLVIAAIGFYDDRTPIPAGYRLGAHFVLFAVAIIGVVPLSPLADELGLPLPWPLLLGLLVLAGVYWINLFNFMDGIDGLAASQAVFMPLAAVALALAAAPGLVGHPGLWWLIALAAASLGFLCLNWPPARIFMGDAGSTYLGFIIAILALLTISWGWLTPWQWAILGAPFVTDATVTLLRRALQREKIVEAHRRHAYQALARRWNSHRLVTLLLIAIDVVWVLPLAFVAGWREGFGSLLTILAYAPLVVMAIVAGAGAPEAEKL